MRRGRSTPTRATARRSGALTLVPLPGQLLDRTVFPPIVVFLVRQRPIGLARSTVVTDGGKETHRLRRPVRATMRPLRGATPTSRKRIRVRNASRIALVGRGSAATDPLADLLRQFDDDPLRAADGAEPVAVLAALQLAHEFRAAGSQVGDDSVDVFDGECDMGMPGVFAGACRLSSWLEGVWNFVSSSRPWPSGVCTTAISARTPSSPTTRSIHRPSTGPSPCSSSPSSTKNSVAAVRSSTTMPTWSIRWIVTMPDGKDSPVESGDTRPERPSHVFMPTTAHPTSTFREPIPC